MATYTREALWLSESSMDFPFHTGYLPYWLLPSHTTYNQGLTSTHFFVLAHPTDAGPPDRPQCLPTTSATTATAHSLLSPGNVHVQRHPGEWAGPPGTLV